MFQYVDATLILITSTIRIPKSIDAPCRRLVWTRTISTVICWSPTHKRLQTLASPVILIVTSSICRYEERNTEKERSAIHALGRGRAPALPMHSTLKPREASL